ncbi:MAG: hypothetical protein KC496_22640, partial [Anaerolineae bacterium]|nr:hypothetical protein [Anaerolineae bacterium]
MNSYPTVPRTARQWLIFEVALRLIIANDSNRTRNQDHILKVAGRVGTLQAGMLLPSGLKWQDVNTYWQSCTTPRQHNLLVNGILDTISDWLRS